MKYPKANDVGVPERELIAAELIAAARSHGFFSTTGAEFRDAADGAQDRRSSKTVSCCAMGALKCSPRLRDRRRHAFPGMIAGNDSGMMYRGFAGGDNFDIGYAFNEGAAAHAG